MMAQGARGADGQRRDRGDRRQGLLQERGDRSLRGGRHRGLRAEAADVERAGRGPIRSRATSSTTPTRTPMSARPARRLTYRMTNERGRQNVALATGRMPAGLAPSKSKCTTEQGTPRPSLGARGDPRARPEAARRRPDAKIVRSQTVEHPFGTIKAWMGATHFKMKTLKHVATEMALHVLAYNLKRVMAILGVRDCSGRCGRDEGRSLRQELRRGCPQISPGASGAQNSEKSARTRQIPPSSLKIAPQARSHTTSRDSCH